jgi:nucleoside-diphosphate-sugar epimerase
MTITSLPMLPEADLNHMYFGLSTSDWQFFAGKRVFFSGGSGFIGKWMLSALLEADKRLALGCKIEILTRSPNKFSLEMPHVASRNNIRLRKGDIRTFIFPEEKFDIVVHAATDVVAHTTHMEKFSACLQGTQHILNFTKICGATDFLLTSSGAIYGPHPLIQGGITENYLGGPDPTLPTSAYAEGKRASEWLACAQAEETGLKVKIARIYAQIGPYLPLDKHFAIGNFISDVLADREIIIRGDGTPRRSYLHAADTAVWLWRMLVLGSPSRAWNVGSEIGLSIEELAHRVSKVLRSTKEIRILTLAQPNQSVEQYVPNISRAREELQIPPIISLDDAIVRTAEWIQKNNLVIR